MIKNVVFHNFKCLHNKSFELNCINVFSGYNGRGKSSVMQFLLMLSQSVSKDSSKFEKLHLTGDYVYLGDFYEIQTDDKDNEVGIDLELKDSNCNNIELSYVLSDEDYKVGKIHKCVIDGKNYIDTVGGLEPVVSTENKSYFNRVPQALIDQFSEVYYVSAGRVGPLKFVEKHEVPEFHNVGTDGSYTINTLSTYRQKIDSSMNIKVDDVEMHNVKDLASQWLSYIMSGGNVFVNGDDDTQHSSVLSLDFSFDNKSFQSYNVGFGYSYILSIIVTALIAKKNSIVVIENPEAHLHPKAQLRLTEMLAKLGSRGVQVFVETHSEHIVNGFRLEALRSNCSLKNSDVSLYFFDCDFSIRHLRLEPNGRINDWPNGFFDQSQYELAEILQLGSSIEK